MKPLRNPKVVGLLALVAVVVVLYQVFGDKLFGPRGVLTYKPPTDSDTSAAPRPVAPPAPPTAAPTTAPKPVPSLPPRRAVTYTNLEAALLPDLRVDATLVEQKFNSWVSAPPRDPFLLFAPSAQAPGSLNDLTNSPVPTWTLHGIWNQTGSRLAVINNRVWRVGEEVEPGYKLIRIERDEVWIQGPLRTERLAFRDPTRGTPTALPPNGGNRT